jgi:hypothetical protein
MQELLGDMYDKYDYFNIILRQVNTGGENVVDDLNPIMWSVSGFDWTNKQNIFSNEKCMGVGYLNDLSTKFNMNSLSANLNQNGFNTINRYYPSFRGFKTFRKQPYVDFKLFVRNTDNNGSTELTNEVSKLYFTFMFDIYPCKNI